MVQVSLKQLEIRIPSAGHGFWLRMIEIHLIKPLRQADLTWQEQTADPLKCSAVGWGSKTGLLLHPGKKFGSQYGTMR
jgi:hypothetical protein